MNRYTVYYYELENKWYVFDNQTCCLVGGTGTLYKQHAQEQADKLNSSETVGQTSH
jgi:hypothetical protein